MLAGGCKVFSRIASYRYLFDFLLSLVVYILIRLIKLSEGNSPLKDLTVCFVSIATKTLRQVEIVEFCQLLHLNYLS